MKNLYEVQTSTLCDGWINTWTIDDKPETFECYEDAIQAIEMHIKESEEDGMDEDRNDFRVVKLNKEVTACADTK
jgi:hypothetical protein